MVFKKANALKLAIIISQFVYVNLKTAASLINEIISQQVLLLMMQFRCFRLPYVIYSSKNKMP
jgi:hypothetical protein